MCGTECNECKNSADFCTKCSDSSKLVSSDGACKTDASMVTCATHQFKDTSGICVDCNNACDASTGCTGKGPDKCLKCSSDFKVVETYTIASSTIYKCAKRCPALSQELTVNGQQVCKQCYSNTAMPVYDFSTKSCIAETKDCPEGTVKTTLDKLADIDSKITATVTIDASAVKVCAM
jgi:hypothetical protein